MSGRHEAPPLGSGAREATASPYAGRHRACEHEYTPNVAGTVEWCQKCDSIRPLPPPDDPDRCPSCGHLYDAGCDDLCCYDNHDEAPDG